MGLGSERHFPAFAKAKFLLSSHCYDPVLRRRPRRRQHASHLVSMACEINSVQHSSTAQRYLKHETFNLNDAALCCLVHISRTFCIAVSSMNFDGVFNKCLRLRALPLDLFFVLEIIPAQSVVSWLRLHIIIGDGSLNL